MADIKCDICGNMYNNTINDICPLSKMKNHIAKAKKVTSKYYHNENIMNEIDAMIETCTHISKYKDVDGKLIRAIGNCIDDKKAGKWLFLRAGELIGAVHFKNGKEHGKTVSYIDGEIATTINYKNGLKDGKMKEYYKGLRIEELEYIKGSEVSRKSISEKEFMKNFPNLTEDDI